MSSIKIERLNHAFQEEISMILMREVKNEALKFVTITGVETTSDLSYAKVYFTILDDSKKDEITKALEKASPFIRTKLAERVEIRHTPELRFIYDSSITYGEHMDSLIEEIKQKENRKES